MKAVGASTTASRGDAVTVRDRTRGGAVIARARGRVVARANGADEGDGWMRQLRKFNPFAKKTDERAVIERRRNERDVVPKDVTEALFGKGVGGKIMGALVNNVAGAIREQMSESMDVARETYDAATRQVRFDRALMEALGGEVTCGPIVSQSSSSVVVNGAKTTRATVAFRAVSASGRGAVVQAESDGVTVRVVARTDVGQVIELGAGSSAGATYDIDPDDVDVIDV